MYFKNIKDIGGEFSVSFWAKYDAGNSWSRIMDFGNGQGIDNIMVANIDTYTKSNMVSHLYDLGTGKANRYSGGGKILYYIYIIKLYLFLIYI